jgi:hypothetical protein
VVALHIAARRFPSAVVRLFNARASSHRFRPPSSVFSTSDLAARSSSRGNTEELSTHWRTPDDGENEQLILCFRLERWSTLRLVKSHGNQLVLRSPWQPFASTLATAFHAPSLYWSLSDSEPGDAGGRTADERLHQTLLRSLQKMPESRRQLCRALDTLACFGRWRT